MVAQGFVYFDKPPGLSPLLGPAPPPAEHPWGLFWQHTSKQHMDLQGMATIEVV
jgi:hypothetical protein